MDKRPLQCDADQPCLAQKLFPTPALKAFKDGRGGIFGGNGIGDLLFCGAAPAIVAMGFR